ncbi:inositol monophosphatase family protein [Pseudodesulfovibrio sp. zrk46]|uniref:inositol monophosphatase family protein n=1 Tax=Pseudodesulfovibrio sp. zrk46 TaxID=2725288 RepID=UPI001448B288|nr:inositol monophosphatase family protein [Pseudodesulfovibrio sp. zrk46]QJB57734.1 inositol monophosphatase [Pseudodesulfovibrio sp. zrk46]
MALYNEKKFCDDLVYILGKAGNIVIDASTQAKKVRHKGRIDLVTETDIAVEEMLKEELSRLLPGSDFLAEESAKDTPLGEFTWIIDPVDGTTNFAHGLPMVATSVGLWHNNRVVLGLVNLPLMGELFFAVEGHGAFLNEKPIRVSRVTTMEEALLATGFPYAIDDHLDTILKQLKSLLPITQGIRRPGAAALDLAYVACGRYDGFYESALNPWDTAAGILLIQEAGGMVSEYESGEPYSFESKSIMATNGLIHKELSCLLCRV